MSSYPSTTDPETKLTTMTTDQPSTVQAQPGDNRLGIDADHITFTDDGHAWWVPLGADDYHDRNGPLDRPCDTCTGHGIFEAEESWEIPCRCIDGRHTFKIEVDWDYPDLQPVGDEPIESDIHRVSIVEGMVLPIVEENEDAVHQPGAISADLSGMFWLGSESDRIGKRTHLPPAAKPGMWAVKLRVAP